MDESDEPKKTVRARASQDAMVVDTMGGRMHVHWDGTAHATPHGQIVFFAEFPATAGVFDRWVQDCPLRYNDVCEQRGLSYLLRLRRDVPRRGD